MITSRRMPAPSTRIVLAPSFRSLLAACSPSCVLVAHARRRRDRARARSAAPSRAAATPQRDDVRAFIAEMAPSTASTARDVERWLAAARFQPKIVALMRPAAPRAAEVVRVRAAVPRAGARRRPASRSGTRNADDARARRERDRRARRRSSSRSSASRRTTAAITGSHRVIDALATLAFDYPRRATFFRGELKEFLLLAREQGFSPLAPKGSFAGAMGVPQFMPGSYRRYAVDFDGDRPRRPVATATPTSIGSVANYLARHDWQRGQPVLLPARIAPEQRDAIAAPARRRPLASAGSRRCGPPTASTPVAWPGVVGPSRSGCCCSRNRDGERELLDRLPQLLRDHALQPQPALRDRGVAARAGDQRRALRRARSRARRERERCSRSLAASSRAARTCATSASVDASVPDRQQRRRRRAPRRSASASVLPSSTPHWSNGFTCHSSDSTYVGARRARAARRAATRRAPAAAASSTRRLPGHTRAATSASTSPRRGPARRARAHLLGRASDEQRLRLRERVRDQQRLLVAERIARAHRHDELDRHRVACPGAATGRTNAARRCRCRPTARAPSVACSGVPSRVTRLPLLSSDSCCRYAGRSRSACA